MRSFWGDQSAVVTGWRPEIDSYGYYGALAVAAMGGPAALLLGQKCWCIVSRTLDSLRVDRLRPRGWVERRLFEPAALGVVSCRRERPGVGRGRRYQVPV